MLAQDVIHFLIQTLDYNLGVDLTNGSTVTGTVVDFNATSLRIRGRKAGVQGEYQVAYADIEALRRRGPVMPDKQPGEVFTCGGAGGGQGRNPGCGEEIRMDATGLPIPASEEIGEFWVEARSTSVVMHAQCGLDAGLPLA
jgi:hypothetical protein